MKKVLDYLFIALFLAMVLIPVYFMNTKHYAVSELDNRVLAFEPEFGEKDFPSKFENYLKDRIGFRSEMIAAYDQINDVVAHELTHPLYTYGKEDYIFANMHPNIEYSEYHQTFARFVKSMQDYCEARGSKFYFVFEPEKASAMQEFLPDGVNYSDEWVNEMLTYMDELGVTYVDNASYLRELAKKKPVFN